MRFALIVACVLTLMPGAAVGQTINQSAHEEQPYRNPEKAQILSIIPGWGYFYTGEYLRGYATWVASIAGPPIGVVMFTFGEGESNRLDRTVDHIGGITAIVSSVVIYISSVRDAKAAAERANDRHARRFDLAPMLRPRSVEGARWEGGLSVHL